jgi:hypothetical protein
MKTLRQQLLVLGALCGAALFAADSGKGTSTAGGPPPDPASVNFPTDPNDPLLDNYRVSVKQTVVISRQNKHQAEWETYTPINGMRLPAWFKCTVTVHGPKKEFTFYEVGAQGKKHNVIIRFDKSSKVTAVDGASGIDLAKPFRIEPMASWDPVNQTGSNSYTVSFTGNQCVFYALYEDYTDLTKTLSSKQPGDGAPPPPGSGQEH